MWNSERLPEASCVILLYGKRITKALIKLRGCAGRSVPLLFACIKIRFSRAEGNLGIIYRIANAYYFDYILWTRNEGVEEPVYMRRLFSLYCTHIAAT